MKDYSDLLKDINISSRTNLKPFFEKIKILSEMEKAVLKAKSFEQDIIFIESLKPLLSENLQIKADEAIKMLPFFSIMPHLKNKQGF